MMLPLCLALFALVATQASAQVATLDQMANSLTSQARPVALLVTVFAFLLGVWMTMAGLMKLHAHTVNPRDPASSPVTAIAFIFAGAAMVALPALISSGVVTIFGDGATTTDAWGRGNVVPFR